MGKLYGALLGLSIIWGTSFLFIKLLVEELGNWGVSFWRCVFGACTLFIVMCFKKEFISWRNIPIRSVIVVGLFNCALPWGLIAYSEMLISSSMASFINASTPLWTMVIGTVWFSVSLSRRQWFGVAVGLIGIGILADIKLESIFSENIYGVLLMLGATFCYGLGGQLTKNHLQQLSVIQISFTTLTAAAILSLLFMLVFDQQLNYKIYTGQTILSLVGLGVFGSGIAYLFYYYLVKKGGPEFASFVTYIVPVSAMFWGAMFLNEQISGRMLVGLIFIFYGVYLSSYKNSKRKQMHVA